MVEKQQFQERQVAFKLNINQIVNSVYEKREGWNPNVLLIGNIEVSRVSVVAVVVSSSSKRLTIDDGTANIEVITFDETDLSGNKSGTPILIIGRVREWQNKRFIAPEIIKQVDKEWLEVRKKELAIMNDIYEINNTATIQNSNKLSEINLTNSNFLESMNQNIKTEEINFNNNSETNVTTKRISTIDVIKFIQTNEEQEADYDGLLDKFGKEVIDKLIESGDVYEIKPGKLKVL